MYEGRGLQALIWNLIWLQREKALVWSILSIFEELQDVCEPSVEGKQGRNVVEIRSESFSGGEGRL